MAVSQSNPTIGKTFDFRERLREISMFFDGTDRVHQTMRRVAQKLKDAGIPHAIVGGMAVNAHRYVLTTGDVDFLLSTEGLAAFMQLFVAQEFDRVIGRPRRFLDRETGITFDVVLTGMFPGSGRPGPIAFPDPAAVSQTINNHQYVNLRTLIELKLAARRYKDFGDVVELTHFNELGEGFADQLHVSVRNDYIECLEEMRREQEYEARQDQAFEKLQRENDGQSQSS